MERIRPDRRAELMKMSKEVLFDEKSFCSNNMSNHMVAVKR
jgi:hypothetical protein